MDSLCERIDQLTINYLKEFGHLIASKQLLDDTIKQGYFNLSRARIIMGVNNLSRLQYSEKDPMIASTKISLSSDPFAIEKQLDTEHADDALKWFGLLSPKVLKQSQKSFQQTIDLALDVCQRQAKICQLQGELERLFDEKKTFLTKENIKIMSEPSPPSKKVQIIRSHQNLNEYVYQAKVPSQENAYEQILLGRKDYYTLGLRRLGIIQSLPLKENWPITIGNSIAAFSSGLIGALITRRMARNLSLHVTLGTVPTSGACFLALTISHLSAWYFLILRPMFSDDPMLCSTCLEIRALTVGSMIPVAMGTSVAVLANLSACLLNKTLRLPRFDPRAYPEWKHFFRRHAFKGMSRRYFVAYPLANGFLASMIFLGQYYYWKNVLRPRLQVLEKQGLPAKEPRRRNRAVGPVEDFFTKLFDNMPGEEKTVIVQTGTSTLTLLIVAIAGGIIAVSLQPLILVLYSHLGLPTVPIAYQPSSSGIIDEQILTATIVTTTRKVETTTAKSDLTVDEEPLFIKDEPVTIKLPQSTTVKPVVREKLKVDKLDETSQSIQFKKATQQPELIDVTGRNKQIPDEVKNYKPTRINPIKTKKLWIPIPNSNGGHRRVPPVSIRAGKEHKSSVKHWLFDEFLSHDECLNLIKVHKEHVKKMKEIDPIICFDSIQTLRKHLKDLKPNTNFYVTPNDFTKGTTCINATFSSMLKQWGLKWSYSTAFYLGESAFSTLLSQRIEEGTNLQSSHGGKFQITSTDKGVGYKTHHDCTLNGSKQDRYATVLAYLNTVTDGGETEFPELEIKIKPKEGRVVVWNNMNEDGECEEKSRHSANIVGDEEGKFVLQRWYYYENFYSLGKRPPEPDEPARKPGQIQVSCDEYDVGSCRAYDEWNYNHILKYRNVNHNLI